MAEPKHLPCMWGYQIKTIHEGNYYVLVDPNTVSDTNEITTTIQPDMLHMSYGPHGLTMPVAFESPANAILYTQDMAREKNDDTLLEYIPLTTTVFEKTNTTQVYLMHLTTVKCKRCGKQIFRMKDFKSGRFFSKITAKCDNCGHEQLVRQLKR